MELSTYVSAEMVASEMFNNPVFASEVLMELASKNCHTVFAKGFNMVGGQQLDAATFLKHAADAVFEKSK